jgi:hypothetical protein
MYKAEFSVVESLLKTHIPEAIAEPIFVLKSFVKRTNKYGDTHLQIRLSREQSDDSLNSGPDSATESVASNLHPAEKELFDKAAFLIPETRTWKYSLKQLKSLEGLNKRWTALIVIKVVRK